MESASPLGNATQLGLRSGSTATVGQYLNETAVPALALLDAGYDIVLATPNGTKPHIDAGAPHRI